MNLIQKNPDDPRYEEFHNGEYEYWPVEDSLKTKRLHFPAAMISGLELVAAVVAAALLAVALSVLHVASAPRLIAQTSAVINVSIYNNHDNAVIRYTLAHDVPPAELLQEGTLSADQDTLYLQDLDPGTVYLLSYYAENMPDSDPVGEFWFVTPGETPPEEPVQTEPESSSATEPPADTERVPDEAYDKDPSGETEDAEAAEESGEDPAAPVVRPPTVLPPVSDPETPVVPDTPATPEPPVVPDTPADPEDNPSIAADEPDLGSVSQPEPYISGDEIIYYFLCEEIHTFRNVPEEGFTVQVVRNGQVLTDFSQVRDTDGTLTVTFTGNQIPLGSSASSTVTVSYDGTEVSSTSTIQPPSLDSVDLTVTPEDDGSHTFTITANVTSDGTETMICEAELYPTLDSEAIPLSLTAQSASLYTASYNTRIQSGYEAERADVVVSAIWSRVSSGMHYQSHYHFYDYNP